jgi:hypothetical protein
LLDLYPSLDLLRKSASPRKRGELRKSPRHGAGLFVRKRDGSRTGWQT